MVRLSRQKTEPVEIPGVGWTVKFTVTARETVGVNANQIIPGQQISFFHGANLLAMENANNDGVCEYQFIFPVIPGVLTYSENVSVRPEPVGSGNTLVDTLTYRKPAIPPRRVDKLFVRVDGGFGNYGVVAVVKDQNELVMSGMDVHVFECLHNDRLQEITGSPVKTDSSGLVYLSLPSFKEKSRRYLVVSGGAVEDARVSGPPSVLPPTKIRQDDLDRIEQEVRGKNFLVRFWLSVKMGWSIGSHDKREQERRINNV